MRVDVEEGDLKKGILALVVALAEVVKETLKLQALRRMEAGSLTQAEVERLGEALLELDGTLDKLKAELGVAEAVETLRHGLDRSVVEAVESLMTGLGEGPCGGE